MAVIRCSRPKLLNDVFLFLLLLSVEPLLQQCAKRGGSDAPIRRKASVVLLGAETHDVGMHPVVSQLHVRVRAIPGRKSVEASVVVFSGLLLCIWTADNTIGIQIH